MKMRLFSMPNAILVAGLIAASSLVVSNHSDAATVEEVQDAVGGGTGTYIDLTNAPAGITNGGITGIWSNYLAGEGDWGFPDGSDGSFTVNSDSADDKNPAGGDMAEIQLDYTGLTASLDYNVYAVVMQNTAVGPISHDIEWGTTSGSLTTIIGTPGFAGADVIQGAAGGGQLVGIFLGQVAADGSGGMTLYFDQAGFAGGGHNEFRTQFDGVLFEAVPEPSTFAMLALAGCLGWFGLRRRS